MSNYKKIVAMDEYRSETLCTKDQYEKQYKDSIENNDAFWEKQAERISWDQKWSKVSDCSYEGDISIKWFQDAKLNVAVNCIDRHLEKRADQIAFYWEPDSPDEEAAKITYKELHEQVCRLSNVLENQGVKKGDRVTLYLPMIPEAVYTMLACARIGAIHSVVFAGFSPDSLAGRINDCDSEFVVTADESVRGDKITALKANVDAALEKCPGVKTVLCVCRTGGSVSMQKGRDHWYHELVEKADNKHEAKSMDAEDPLFILYTSGSTGKPKGVLHTSGGYLVYASMTHQYVFDYQEGDVYWCAADVGWITGHSYIVYGPLANGATSVLFEGTPTYPTANRHWQIVDKYQVNSYYTAPTLIRALMSKGEEALKDTNRSSLRLLGSVGEPINPEAWKWYFEEIGNKKCPIVDTWWQTETGGIMITPLPAARDLKPGSATLPFFGIETALLDDQGKEFQGEGSGSLVIKRSWPGQMRTVYGDHKRFKDTYFSQYPSYYFSGDGCYRDEDGFLWITGRMDDVINVSGHRMGTAEVESSLVANPEISEAAVVGFPHEIKGQGIYAYIVLNESSSKSQADSKEFVQWVRNDIGAIAAPEHVHVVKALPKTRSGKIMRRILRKIAAGDTENLGDISTLAESEVVDEILSNRLTK
ncbi:MAG: acetate--CoA ligase [Bdellovibrionota bacterium]|nr:acetate--CoA ligase [Bdellovibrionota bacterium]